MALHRRVIRTHAHVLRVGIRHPHRRADDIFRQIDHYRAWAAAGSQVERLLQHRRDVFGAFYQEAVLHHRTRNPHHIALLEGVVADQRAGHLSRQHHHRDRIHIGGGNTGNGIGGAGAGGHQHHAHFTGGARVTVGHVHRTLLVAHQNMIDPSDRMQGVVDIEHRPAGVAEYMLNALIDQRSDDHLGS